MCAWDHIAENDRRMPNVEARVIRKERLHVLKRKGPRLEEYGSTSGFVLIRRDGRPVGAMIHTDVGSEVYMQILAPDVSPLMRNLLEVMESDWHGLWKFATPPWGGPLELPPRPRLRPTPGRPIAPH
jgi:hypothetical protein